MPELPEVQTIVDELNKKVAGRTITDVWFDWPKLIKNPADQSRIKIAYAHVAGFKKSLQGSRIEIVKRRAKNILIYLSGDQVALIHLKMTGHLLVGKWNIEGKKVIPIEPRPVVEDPYNGYIHLILYLNDGRMLALSDLRKFAKVILGPTEVIENLKELQQLGPEPLDREFTFIQFAEIISRERRKIKQVLMDPNVISGIGNIYSDDILWTAKIHPFKPANKLKRQELEAIWKAVRDVLTKALKLRGTSTSDFRNTEGKEGGYTDYRLVYQREGESCARCKTEIRRLKMGGRSAHFCPKCQKLK